jgi:hypothetical protein
MQQVPGRSHSSTETKFYLLTKSTAKKDATRMWTKLPFGFVPRSMMLESKHTHRWSGWWATLVRVRVLDLQANRGINLEDTGPTVFQHRISDADAISMAVLHAAITADYKV